jgi:4-hydroxy-4-methyl-2-oxoglutarate aldolase
MKAGQGVAPGAVTLWIGNSICYFGELIAIGIKERGCVGSLVDGGIQDVRWIGQQPFPVFARFRIFVQSIGRWKVNVWQVPVSLRRATTRLVSLKPSDSTFGDEDGVIAIPAELVQTVLEGDERLTNTETLTRS